MVNLGIGLRFKFSSEHVGYCLHPYEVHELSDIDSLAPESVDFDINSFIDSTKQ